MVQVPHDQRATGLEEVSMITHAEKSAKSPVGAVLVVGGGVAGIQAALDLSTSGYKVYLLERDSALGGHMAMLDKTFPTNDCSMCTMSPRLVSVAQDNNIEILTLADLTRLEGEAGRFTATVQLRPHYVNSEKCTGCGECSAVCPVEIDNKFNQCLDKRKAIYRLYPQAVPNTFVIERDERPRCMRSCPLGTNPQGYIALIRQRRYHEAMQSLRETNPLPSICARVCHHPCELHCARAAYDAPLSVMSLKRFLADYCRANPPDPELQAQLEAYDERAGRVKAPATGKRVAVVGSGPGGLAGGEHLARCGHEVVIFEALSVAGGMLRVGIPDFRLPSDVLDGDIQSIRELGVEIRCDQRLGRDFTIESLRGSGFDAVLLAIGAHRSRKLGLEGEDAPNLLDGIDFLRSVNLGHKPEIGPRVAIIGGGNVAVDVGRTARRLGGADVTILYRRSEEEMPALPEEVTHAREEGVQLQILVAPVRVVLGEDGRATGLECVRMRLGEPDESGRCRPVPIPGTNFFVEADTIIAAIGQSTDTEALDGDIQTDRGAITVEPKTLATRVGGVFAAGDAVTGPQTVTGAMSQGRRAAISIDNYLNKRPLDTDQTDPRPVELPPLERERLRKPDVETPRQKVPMIPLDGAIKSFNEVNLVMDEQTALAEAERCLNCGICSDCHQCARICQADAICFDESTRERQIEVGGVILAGGHDMFDPHRRGEFGYGRYPNVVTSLEFERLLSASGPTVGRVLRPGDGKEAKRIAFIQCVGSRDTTSRGNEYCSGVCCMYTTKAAMIAMEHTEGLAATIFMIDMRAHGKGYEEYYLRAESMGVRYVRSMVSVVRQDFGTGDLLVEYAGEDATNHNETFDMVVLATGLQCRLSLTELAGSLSVELDEYGFVRSEASNPIATSRNGVMVCGTAMGPKDIPDSVTDASAAAAMLCENLTDARFTCISEPEYPPERDVSTEPPRVGVFICHCGNNIAGVVDVENLVEFANKLPGVAYAERNLYTCSPDGLAAIQDAIDRENLNRVVVASCTHRTHAAIFQQAMMAAGLNKYLFEMANIRDQCTWVHGSEPAEALIKAQNLIASAVAKARCLSPLQEQTQPVEHAGLVVGGGLAGMVAAGNLARQGFEVHLVERENELGGQLREIRHTLEGLDVQTLMNRLIDQTLAETRITVHLDSTIESHKGAVGNFESIISGSDGGERIVRHGVTIVATGAEMYEPSEYGYGACEKVITQRELERRLGDGSADSLNTVVMIQCVGCRNEERQYCSRICCGEAVKNALEIKQRNPPARVVIIYKDVRTFGRMEKYYHEAREQGVLFVRYDDEHEPQVLPDGTVHVTDLALNRELTFASDLVVLSAAVVAPKTNKVLSEALRVPMTLDGFFLEAHIKLRPVDFACEGVFLAGMAHGPKFVGETMAQALAAAGRAGGILSKESLTASGSVATVDRERCAACLTCVRVCPYGVPQIEDDVAVIEPTACQGCGTCSAQCPAGAISLQCFTDEQIEAAVSGLFERRTGEMQEVGES